MRKSNEVENPKSCLNRAGSHELLFVLLSRDDAAPVAIRAWIEERIRIGKNLRTDEQLVEAERCADAMEKERGLYGLPCCPTTPAPSVPPEQNV